MIVGYYARKFAWLGVAAVVIAAPIGSSPPAVHAQDITISSAQDCDANAVIFCGASSISQLTSRYNGGDGHNSAASIQHIYGFFGVSAADIASMSSSSTTVIAGKVTSSGNVHDASDHVIATGASTGGRQNIAGSTRHDAGGTIFFSRPTSVSIHSSSLPAFVVMINGQFSFAIIANCGNPVMATPRVTPKPQPTPQPQPQPTPTPQPQPQPTPQPSPTPKSQMSVNKLVAVMGSEDFEKSISVPAGSQVTFKVALKSIGDAPVSNIIISDHLPAHVAAVNASLHRIDQSELSADQTSFFASGISIPSLADEVTFTYDAVVVSNDIAPNRNQPHNHHQPLNLK